MFKLVENEEHCEFIYLRNFLTRTHLQDLIETTAQIHYEAFRAKQLLAIKESTQPQTPNANAGHSNLGSNVLASGAGNPAMGSPAQSNK
jgi:septin 3/9/12